MNSEQVLSTPGQEVRSGEQGRGGAAYAMASLLARVVELLHSCHPQLRRARELLSSATDRFFQADYRDAHALAHEGIELLASPLPATPLPDQPLPPPPPLSPPTVGEGLISGLATVMEEGYANVRLVVTMIASDGRLVQLEFNDQKQATFHDDPWVMRGSVVSIEFEVNGGNLRLQSFRIVWHAADPRC